MTKNEKIRIIKQVLCEYVDDLAYGYDFYSEALDNIAEDILSRLDGEDGFF